MSSNDTHLIAGDRLTAIWLLSCALVIYAMILLGGVTRLTGSGLSMVDWRPIMGVIPPLSEQDWQQTFAAYKQFPEYQKVNAGMDLHGFKQIFMFEYLHRLLGRLIGVLFLFPFLWLWFSGHIHKRLTPRLIGLFVLGGLQGLLGWYMVKSGLVDRPQVSQYRLTAHLGLAVAIYGVMLWLALGQFLGVAVSRVSDRLVTLSRWLVLLVFVMILSGGLVAGTHAGLIYNSFPLMHGVWIPPEIYSHDPLWLSPFEDMATIQFNHRLLALTLVLLIVPFLMAVLKSRRESSVRLAAMLVLLALGTQVSLGVATLLHHVPVSLASMHQGGAIALLSAMIFLSYSLSRSAAVASRR